MGVYSTSAIAPQMKTLRMPLPKPRTVCVVCSLLTKFLEFARFTPRRCSRSQRFIRGDSAGKGASNGIMRALYFRRGGCVTTGPRLCRW